MRVRGEPIYDQSSLSLFEERTHPSRIILLALPLVFRRASNRQSSCTHTRRGAISARPFDSPDIAAYVLHISACLNYLKTSQPTALGLGNAVASLKVVCLRADHEAL